MAEVRMCSNCGEETAVDGHAWGKVCKAKKQREYEIAKSEMLAARCFLEGVNAMKSIAVRAFSTYGTRMFAGMEVAQMIQSEPPPKRVT